MQGTRSRKQRNAASTRLERYLQGAPALTGVLIVLFALVPLVVVTVIGIVQGALPEDGWVGEGSGYPAFQPPFWLLWLPGIIALLWAILTIPKSGLFPSPFWNARLSMFAVCFMGLSLTVLASIAYGGPQFVALMWLIVVWAAALVLIALRGLLGMLRLIPKAWR